MAKRNLQHAIGVALLLPGAALAVELPLVSAEVVAGLAPAATVVQREGHAVSRDPHAPLEVVLTPGVNEIISASLGHINRLVTPFPKPEVRTASAAEITVQGSVVYVAPQNELPVTMYITQSGNENLALSVTLNPMRIPPVEARIKVAGFDPEEFQREHALQELELESMPYVRRIRDVMRHLALGEVPSGYNLRPVQLNGSPCRVPAQVAAALPGQVQFDFSAAQRIEGAAMIATVGRVTYQPGPGASAPVELNELWCGAQGTAAVAFWPSPQLRPGESAEVFVLERREQRTGPRSTRPSLLPGGGQ